MRTKEEHLDEVQAREVAALEAELARVQERLEHVKSDEYRSRLAANLYPEQVSLAMLRKSQIASISTPRVSQEIDAALVKRATQIISAAEQQTGGEQTGGEQTGGEQTGGEQTGGEQTGKPGSK